MQQLRSHQSRKGTGCSTQAHTLTHTHKQSGAHAAQACRLRGPLQQPPALVLQPREASDGR